MAIEAVTRIDYSAYHKFFLFTLMKNKRSRWQTPLLLGLSPLLAIAFLVLYIRNSADVLNLVGLIIMLFMSLIMFGIVLVLPKVYYKSMEDQLMIPTHYRFEDAGVTYWSEDAVNMKSTYLFEKIDTATETDGYFYVNLGPGVISIINRDAFIEGTADDLHTLLAEKLGDKLTVSRKEKGEQI